MRPAMRSMMPMPARSALQSMLSLPPGFPHADWAAQWNASVGAACGGAALRSALQRCINIYPSLRVLASIADVAAASALRAGQLSTSALLAAVERQLGQRKAMVGFFPLQGCFVGQAWMATACTPGCKGSGLSVSLCTLPAQQLLSPHPLTPRILTPRPFPTFPCRSTASPPCPSWTWPCWWRCTD